MDLETVAFEQDLFSLYGFGFEPEYDIMTGTGIQTLDNMKNDEATLEKSLTGVNYFDTSVPAGECDVGINFCSLLEDFGGEQGTFPAAAVAGRRNKQRRRVVKKREKVESRRRKQISVERSHRKQMNEYLSMLQSMMPPTYADRGDQASIVGRGFNFVKELEQLLQSLEAQRKEPHSTTNDTSSSPLANFFAFLQYSTDPTKLNQYASPTTSTMATPEGPKTAIAEVEVMKVNGQANVKVLSRNQPKLLMKMLVGLQSLGLNVHHLNVTTGDDMALYSFSVIVEETCQLGSIHEIADAVHDIVHRIQEEATFK